VESRPCAAQTRPRCLARSILKGTAARVSSKADIRKRDLAWEAAVQAKDFDRVLDFYRDDCVGMFTGLPMSVGKSSIGDIWRRVLSRSELNLHWKPTHIELARSGELAYDFGSMTLTYIDTKGAKVDFVGKYIVVWKKGADGQWRVAVDASNPDTAQDVQYNK
jgi:ketosteroid isomerase-like protein